MRALLLTVVLLVLPAAPAHCDDKVLHGLLAGSMVLHGADVSTSMYKFGQDPQRYREANVLLRPFQQQPVAFGLAKTGLAAGMNLLLVSQHEKHPTLVKWVLVVQNAVIAGVVVHNARLK